MLDCDFCIFLEFKICDALDSVETNAFWGLWCDGVLLSEPDIYYSRKYINDNRQVRLKAFVGEDGQTVYELTLKFGPKALSRCARGLSIRECVPTADTKDWFSIDFEEKRIEIQLS